MQKKTDYVGEYIELESNTKPTVDQLIGIADALNISLDLLTGRTSTELDFKNVPRIIDIQNMGPRHQENMYYASMLSFGMINTVRFKGWPNCNRSQKITLNERRLYKSFLCKFLSSQFSS